jgi:hypothetical protein
MSKMRHRSLVTRLCVTIRLIRETPRTGLQGPGSKRLLLLLSKGIGGER